MKNIFNSTFFLVLIFLSSCRSEINNMEDPIIEKFSLKEGTKNDLSSFSHIMGIYQIDIKKEKAINNYTILTIRLDKNNNQTADSFLVKYDKNNFEISTVINLNKKYNLTKDLNTNLLYFYANGEKYNVTQDFIDKINNKIFSYEFNRLMCLYIELYDKSIKRENILSARKNSFAVFESGIGFTKTAAEIRANYAAQEYLNEPGHQLCVLRGIDTSCVTDSHVCYSTATIECPQ